MALPTSRNRTYAADDEIRATDLNDLQDCIVSGLHGEIWHSVFPRGFDDNNVTADYTNGYVYANPGAANVFSCPIQVAEGTRITAFAARVAGTGAGSNVVVRLRRYDGDGTMTVLGTLTITTPSTTWTTYSHTLSAAATVAEGESFSFDADIPTTNQKIAAFRFLTDNL